MPDGWLTERQLDALIRLLSGWVTGDDPRALAAVREQLLTGLLEVKSSRMQFGHPDVPGGGFLDGSRDA